jgi:SAM-dependent methyltransferase
VSDPQGLAFDPVAADYDRGRAGWPLELIADVGGQTALDLAAGTGKLTGLLVERFPEVIAVEPSPGMRLLLERNVPQARSLEGSAETIPVADASVDAVFVAEAFHWFDSHAAVSEIARVLRPGGVLLVCFNEWRSQYEPPIGETAHEAIETRAAKLPPPGGPKVASGEWKRGFGGAPFTPLEERTFDHEWVTDREGVAAYYVSISSIAQLPNDERDELRRELLDLLPPVPYTLALTARRFTNRRL